MRLRQIGLGAFALLLSALLVLGGLGGGVRAQDEGTPEPAPAEDVAEDEGTPTPAATTQIVTLVGWYTYNEERDVLELGPLETNDFLVAGPGELTERSLTGTVDFDAEANDDLPRIRLGETILDAFPVVPDDPATTNRWLYFDDVAGERPATLVMQVSATAGPYEGFTGTATFVSRIQTPSSGVIVIVLEPPAEE